MLDFGFYNMDCMEGMKQFPDKYFDLAIVDPPYGDGGGSGQVMNDSENGSTVTGRVHYQHKNCRKPDGTWGYPNWKNEDEKIRKKIIAWDVAPKQEYFNELFRVSRNQIIWGGNYFSLPPARCFLIWRKLTISENFSMAMAEYAWTSFNSNAKVFECAPQDPTGERFHPTQKPIKLYDWILQHYAKEGDKILDTHVGSASSLIAFENHGFDYVGFEIDEDYYKLASNRLETEGSQITIWNMDLPNYNK